MWSRAELKTRAKEVLKLNYWKAVLVAFIYSFLSGGGGGGGGSASSSASGSGSSGSSSSGGGLFSDMSPEALTAFFIAISAFLAVFLVILAVSLALSFFVFNPLIVGCHRFFVKCGEGEANINDVGFAFSSSYMNVVKITFFQSLYIFLWSLLFFIPGIVKSYEYRMIPYLLAENPDMSKADAFRLSKQMMDGEKWRTFVLDLSFVGWSILGVFTCCILIVFYVGPYQLLTDAELYRVLKQKVYGNPYTTLENNTSSENTYQ